MPRPPVETVHATCVALGQCGVLLTGPSGSGKSDLALRLIDGAGSLSPALLVADDRVVVTSRDGRLIASPPPAIAGLIEIRGIGLVRLRHADSIEIGLVVELVEPAAVQRLPERATMRIAGVELPHFALAPFEASTPAKIRAAVEALAGATFVADPC